MYICMAQLAQNGPELYTPETQRIFGKLIGVQYGKTTDSYDDLAFLYTLVFSDLIMRNTFRNFEIPCLLKR